MLNLMASLESACLPYSVRSFTRVRGVELETGPARHSRVLECFRRLKVTPRKSAASINTQFDVNSEISQRQPTPQCLTSLREKGLCPAPKAILSAISAMLQIKYLAAVLLLASACAGGAAPADSCDAPDPWEAVIEDWATAERGNLTRHGRIMSLPPSQGYYVTDRIDLVPPPPPRAPQSQMHHRGPYPMPGHAGSAHHRPTGGPSGNSYNHGPPSSSNQHPQLNSNSYQPAPQNPGPPSGGPSHGPPSGAQSNGPPSSQTQQGPMPYDEWQATPPPPPGAGKIVNRPPNPYKDQFKPSYPPASHPTIPVQSADRVDAAPPAPPQKQVSETDLYLLRAIEKLVYRVDLMEKRMRKMEENMHYIVAGTEAKPEPCLSNFTRVGDSCYHFSSEAANWKGASFACRKLKGYLLELDAEEKRQFAIGLQANKKLKGADFWTGGLNPGLLWIWSHSAKPVATNGTGAEPIAGEGRCLALLAAPATADYVYRGQDCALKHRYVCERDEDKEKLSNEIERVAKSLREKRKPKIAWGGTDLGLF